MQSAMVTQSQTKKQKGGNPVIYVTEVEKENPVVCGCLSAKSYSLLAAAGFAAMAYKIEQEKLSTFIELLAQVQDTNGENVFHVLDEVNYYSFYLKYLLAALAMFHLLLVFTSSPAVFNLVAGLYDLGKWPFYVLAAILYYFAGEQMVEYESSDGAKIFLLLGLYVTAIGCTMTSVGNVYYHYAKDLEKKQAQEEQNQIFAA
jgi:hypothetical protein